MQTVFLPARLFLVGMAVAMIFSGSVAPAARSPATLGEPNLRVNAGQDAPAAEFDRAPDGLFYVVGKVHGHNIRFLVDTGASVVMLTRGDATAIGADPSPGEFQSRVRTANGLSAIAWTTLNHIDIAGHSLSRIDAVVAQSGLPVSLLGQNLIRKLGIVTIDGDHLRVHRRTAVH